MPEYASQTNIPGGAALAHVSPDDLTPRAPVALLVNASLDPRTHEHAWSPVTLRCVTCGWSYYAVLARLKAQQEAL